MIVFSNVVVIRKDRQSIEKSRIENNRRFLLSTLNIFHTFI